MPLDNYLENLELTCGQVRTTHRDRLVWKYKPKLDLAKEKVDKLEKMFRKMPKAFKMQALVLQRKNKNLFHNVKIFWI